MWLQGGPAVGMGLRLQRRLPAAEWNPGKEGAVAALPRPPGSAEWKSGGEPRRLTRSRAQQGVRYLGDVGRLGGGGQRART